MNYRIAIFFQVFISVSILYSATQWEFIGLQNHYIHCLALDDQQTLLAGTDNGIYSKRVTDVTWKHIEESFGTVHTICCVNQKLFLATQACDSKSDGVYAGIKVDSSSEYTMQLISYMENAQCIESAGFEGDTLYAGNHRTLAFSYRPNQSEFFTDLLPLKGVDTSFGLKDPFCAAIHYSPFDKVIYAGGYDRTSESSTSYLLSNRFNPDTFNRLGQKQVSSICEFGQSAGLMSGIFVGTRDSGIFVYPFRISSLPIQRYNSPNNEPINHICTIELSGMPIPNIKKTILVAVSSGLYLMNPPSMINDQPRWIPLAGIDKPPLSMVCTNDKQEYRGTYRIYVATKNGVYGLRSLQTSITQKILAHPSHSLTIIRKNNHPFISISLNRTSHVTINALDCKGRHLYQLINRSLQSGNHLIAVEKYSHTTFTSSPGITILECIIDKKTTTHTLSLLYSFGAAE